MKWGHGGVSAGLSSPVLLTKGWRRPLGPGPWESVCFICFCSGTSLANCLASPWLEIWGSSMSLLPPRITSPVNLSFVCIKSYISSFLPWPPPFLPPPAATTLVSSEPSCFQLDVPPADPVPLEEIPKLHVVPLPSRPTPNFRLLPFVWILLPCFLFLPLLPVWACLSSLAFSPANPPLVPGGLPSPLLRMPSSSPSVQTC